jgi:hypothetical protein
VTKNEIPVDRIREYLRRLTSHARSNLRVNIERMQLHGEDISGSAIVLAELRAEFRNSGQSSHRAGNPSRYSLANPPRKGASYCQSLTGRGDG